MNSTHTANLVIGSDWPDIPPSGNWSQEIQKPTAVGQGFVGAMRVAGMALALVAAPSTASADVWFLDRRRQTSTVSPLSAQLAFPRRISLNEAAEIALRILLDAERERIRIADEEAGRGINWEALL